MKYPQIIRDMIDFTSDTEVCNIGYNEGTLKDKRPYRLEVWSSYGVTNATIFISIKDLEDKSEEEIKNILVDNELIKIIEDDIYITEVEDSSDNSFLSINIPLNEGEKTINECNIKLSEYVF